MIAPGKRSSSSHSLTLAARDYLVCPSLGCAFWRSESSPRGS